MKKGIIYFILLIASALGFSSCEPTVTKTEVHTLNLADKTASQEMIASTKDFTSYLPIYSSIYTLTEKKNRPLTSTVSIHNMNLNERLIVKEINYYNSEGDFVRSYIDAPIFLKSMETFNIVLYEKDNDGGTGANFLIKWGIKDPNANQPLIEAVMISTSRQQGISFTTKGVVMGS